MRVGVYQQSAVGRDMLVELFEMAGAQVIPFGVSDVFVPLDTKGVRDETKKTLKDYAETCCGRHY